VREPAVAANGWHRRDCPPAPDGQLRGMRQRGRSQHGRYTYAGSGQSSRHLAQSPAPWWGLVGSEAARTLASGLPSTCPAARAEGRLRFHSAPLTSRTGPELAHVEALRQRSTAWLESTRPMPVDEAWRTAPAACSDAAMEPTRELGIEANQVLHTVLRGKLGRLLFSRVLAKIRICKKSSPCAPPSRRCRRL
jgi:hypothetical protein